jgi:hypothetical protein
MTFEDYHAVMNLISRYAEYADLGDWEAIGRHYAHCVLVWPDGSKLDVAEEGVQAYVDWYDGMIRRYGENGRPRTRRLMGSIIIEDGPAGQIKAQCKVLCFQATDTLPLQAIAAGTLYDTFEKIDGAWQIVERREDLELVGDLSQHLKGPALLG